MMHRMLTDVIVDTFEEKVDRWQIKKSTVPKALKVSFRVRVDHDKEEGYRQVHMLIYAPMNYVSVYLKETSDTIQVSDMEEQRGEMVPQEGKDYVKAETAWRRICHHDSEWRSAISDYLWQNRDTITGFDKLFRKFYEVIDVPIEILASLE